jgi:hypothetical protein
MPSPPGPIRLELEVDAHGDHIAGRIGDAKGQVVPFTGWLELIAAIEALSESRPGPRSGNGGARGV